MAKGEVEAPEQLDDDSKRELIRWCKREFPHYVAPRQAELGYPKLADVVGACLDHHGSKGTLRKNWRRACQSWIRKEHNGKWKQASSGQEKREQSEAGFELLGDVIQLHGLKREGEKG